MSAIPVHIERCFEQRWAARLVQPGALISPTSLDLKLKNSPPRAAGRAASGSDDEEAANRAGPYSTNLRVEIGHFPS